MICKKCEFEVFNKKWGYANLCEDCDTPEKIRKSMAIITISESESDYSLEIVSNPTPKQVKLITVLNKVDDASAKLKSFIK